jgi:hypothetical protein
MGMGTGGGGGHTDMTLVGGCMYWICDSPSFRSSLDDC